MSTISLAPTYDARPVRAVRPARPAAPAGELRLTRRGRVVVFLFAMLVACAVAFVLAGGSSASSEDEAGDAVIPTTAITVAPGQTLWQIASEHAPDGDVRAAVDAIERLNGLDSAMLVAGQELFVPAE